MSEYLDRAALLALDLDPDIAEQLLADSPLSGHDGRPCIEADRLEDMLADITE